MKQEWILESRLKECFYCKRTFTSGDIYYGILTKHRDVYERRDYCSICWENISSEQKKQYFSYWRGVLPEKKDEDEEPLNNTDKVEQLLRNLIDHDPVPVKVCYILAIIMERKKIIKQVADTYNPDEQKRFLVFEFCKTGESITLVDPHVKLDEIPQLQAEISNAVWDKL